MNATLVKACAAKPKFGVVHQSCDPNKDINVAYSACDETGKVKHLEAAALTCLPNVTLESVSDMCKGGPTTFQGRVQDERTQKCLLAHEIQCTYDARTRKCVLGGSTSTPGCKSE